MSISIQAKGNIRRGLLLWYQKNKRDLPWRKKKSAYRTLVSEIMLQQTQIKTVIPYFERWMKAFPTIEKLAKAKLGKVLKLWEGLGYYSRARNFHKAAKIIASKHHGKIPSDYNILISLPGIGRYTAGAISSIAFNQPVALVDGNVSRVLTRIFDIHDDILKLETQKELYKIADQLVPPENPGDFNQALMELGSLVCFPSMPNCGDCPLKNICLARRKGTQESLPVKSKQAPKKNVYIFAGIIRNREKILVRERPHTGIWGGLWELPNIHGKSHKIEGGWQRSLPFGEQLLPVSEEFERVTHQLTHLNVTILPFAFEIKNTSPGDCPRFWGLSPLREKTKAGANSNLRWIDQSDLRRLSFPVPFQKIMRAVFHNEK